MPGKDKKGYKGWRGTIAAALQHHPEKFSKEACKKDGDSGKLCPYAIFTDKKKDGDTPHYKEQPHTTKGKPKKKKEFKNEWSFAHYVEKRDQQNEGIMDTIKGFGQKAALAGTLMSPFAGQAQAQNKPPPPQPVQKQQAQQQQFKVELVTVPVNVKIKASSSGHAPNDLNTAYDILKKKAWEELQGELKLKGIDVNQVRAFVAQTGPVVPDDALDDEKARTKFDVKDLVYDGIPFANLPKGKINAKVVELHGQVTFRVIMPK